MREDAGDKAAPACSEITSDPDALILLLQSTRDQYQRGLLTATEARRQFEASLNASDISGQDQIARWIPNHATWERLQRHWQTSGISGRSPTSTVTPTTASEARALWAAAEDRCEELLHRHQQARLARSAQKNLFFRKKAPEPTLPGAYQDQLHVLQTVASVYTQLRAQEAQASDVARVTGLETAYREACQRRDRVLKQQLERNIADIQMGIDLLGQDGQPWPARLLDITPARQLHTLVRLGQVVSGLPKPYDITVPCVIEFPGTSNLAIESAPQSRSRSIQLARSLVLRLLLGTPPGSLRVTFIDPTALGQTFSDFLVLGDYDERLIDTGVKTSAHAIERCLSEHVSHLETLVSKYLRGQFRTIHDYNVHAGEMREPYRLLVVADYPRQFSDRAAEQLLSLIENGPRCGIYTVLTYSPEDEFPRTVPLGRLTQSMRLVRVRSQTCELVRGGVPPITLEADQCPDITFGPDGRSASAAAEALDAIGRASRSSGEKTVALDNFLPAVNLHRAGVLPDFFPGSPPLSESPDTWWTATTIDQAVAPLGRSGAQGVASLYFSSTEVAGGAIMVGLPRSGKTTSLHAMILMMALLYSPNELELYLIDAKHGVEFKVYEHLPHARMVSIHSDREMSLAVLKSLQVKIRERAELFKRAASGLSNITEYRYATGDPLPRIVVIIDEFHELFEEADRIGLEAFGAFSDIVRMGPFSGVHVVVASQTLSSMPAMDRQTLTLLPQRVAFMCNEYDAEIVMGDTNRATRLLNKTGEGLFNPMRGDEARNQPFQGLYVSPVPRARLLQLLRAKAVAEGHIHHPRVFDGDTPVVRPVLSRPTVMTSRLSIAVGEPFTLAATQTVTFRRSRGGNLLILGDTLDDEGGDTSARAVSQSILLALQGSPGVATIIDFLGDAEPEGALTMREVANVSGARYSRSAGLRPTLVEVAELVASRTASEAYDAEPQILILFGLQRALALSPYDPYDVGDGPNETEAPLCTILAGIMTNGPEVGMHTIIAADHNRSVEARLGPDLLSEMALRVAGSGADQRDLAITAGEYGDIPTLRSGQLLVADILKGIVTRARGYDILYRDNPYRSQEA